MLSSALSIPRGSEVAADPRKVWHRYYTWGQGKSRQTLWIIQSAPALRTIALEQWFSSRDHVWRQF